MKHTLALLIAAAWAAPAVAQIPDPVRYEVTYTYDDARRLTGVEVRDYLTLSYAYDAAGNRTSATGSPQSGVAVESPAGDLPTEVALYTGYPNPFNPTTQIRYDLPAPGHVRIDVFDATGRLVQTLLDTELYAGRHVVSWDARQGGRMLSSGAYFVRLQAGDRTRVRSVMLVK